MTNFIELARKGRTEALVRLGTAKGAGPRSRSVGGQSVVAFTSVRSGR
jgi:hypothetical protein